MRRSEGHAATNLEVTKWRGTHLVRSSDYTLAGDASAAAFPLGGIGTGNVGLGARGEFRDWEIFNKPAKGTRLPCTFFAIRAQPEGGTPVARILESRLQPPHERTAGYEIGDLAGLPRFRSSRFLGEYPFLRLDLVDEEMPLLVSLEAFTPLIPLDAAESGLPAAILRYRLRNPTSDDIDVTVIGSLLNPVGLETTRTSDFPFGPKYRGQPSNDFRALDQLRGLFFTSTLSPTDLGHGSVALVTASRDVTVRRDWSPVWPADELSDFWRDFVDDGRLDAETPRDPEAVAEALAAVRQRTSPKLWELINRLQQDSLSLRVGTLGVIDKVPAGQERCCEFILAWHFPNRPRAWLGQLLDDTNADETIRNFYATRFDDAWRVAEHLHENLADLEASSREFHDSLFGSTLPSEVIDAVASNMTVLRSTTCFRLEDGTFAGWEGSLDDVGSCEGNCTHVWNYAQTGAFLFPELERAMRRVEFTLETDDDGKMNFRSNRIFDGEPWRFPPAVDGQLGAIVRLYREWQFSGDEAFLRDLWPSAAKALDFSIAHWDLDGDFVLDGEQHTTYDIEFYGATSYANATFYAALLAAAEMAAYLGESALSEHYRTLASDGAKEMDRLLWNGEYYIQQLQDVDAHPHQYGTGCLSDQLFGQFLAHVVGLGHVLPREHVQRAIASVYDHNFRANLMNHENFLRTFALDDEAGLVLCSWPNGGRPRRPFQFCDEVWSGTEYQVAAHLIYEGFVNEGLELVRAVRRRHDGYRRNPWNEVEAGSHYVRSLASWGLLLALSGFRYDGVRHAISFTPATPFADVFRCFFSAGTGWGTFALNPEQATLALSFGTLELSRFSIRLPQGAKVRSVTHDGQPLATRIELDGERTTVCLDQIRISANESLCVELEYL